MVDVEKRATYQRELRKAFRPERRYLLARDP
jgi:hypothetical protein